MKKYLSLLLALLLLPLPALAGDWVQHHFLLQDRDLGSCKDLVGDISLYVIWGSEAGSPWDQALLDQVKETIAVTAAEIEAEAARYGQSLSIRPVHYMADGMESLDVGDPDRLMNTALEKAGLPARGENSLYVQREIPLLLILNREGRAFSCNDASETYNDFVVCFAATGARSYTHELLHLYGAWDYYYPEAYRAAAQAYFPDSLMLATSESNTIDSLTAYVIGWTDTPDQAALSFLQDTAHIDEAAYQQALSDASFSGYRIKEYGDKIYIGQWETGAWHGQGLVAWESGALYTGDFVSGSYQGSGTMVYGGGSLYTGQYENGKKHGQGVMVWADQTIYRGQWVQDQRTGQGILLWPNGEIYIGEFLNGQIHGYGVYTNAEGQVFEGNWANGQLISE